MEQDRTDKMRKIVDEIDDTTYLIEERRRKIKVYIIIFALIAVLVFALALVFRNIVDSKAYDKYIQTAELSMSNSDYDSALSSLRKAAAIDKSRQCILLMSKCYEAQGNHEKALDVLRMLDATDPAIAAEVGLIEEKRKAEEAQGFVSIAGTNHKIGETSLVLDGQGLDNSVLNEVVKLYALDNLSVANNSLTDISPIASLAGLTTLNLNGNQISDISPLTKLANLRTLYLDNNPIGDISPVYSMTSLTSLSIKGLTMTDTELQNLSKALPNCAINGVDARADNPVIALGGVSFNADVTELNLSGRGITDITALSGCTKLVNLNLSGNSISDITPLMDIPTIAYLNISANAITDLRPLMGISTIKSLNASDNYISSTVPVSANTALIELNLNNNPISDFSGLRKLKNLNSLSIANTGFKDSDAQYFTYLSRLMSMNIENNPAVTGEGFDNLQSIIPTCSITHSELVYTKQIDGKAVTSDSRELNLPNSNIGDLSGLMQLNQLQYVNLAGNKIDNLYYFSLTESWRTMTYLDLSNNLITDISPLSKLNFLETLNLSGNQIKDATPLYALTNLKTLYISGTQLSDDQIYGLETNLTNCEIITK